MEQPKIKIDISHFDFEKIDPLVQNCRIKYEEKFNKAFEILLNECVSQLILDKVSQLLINMYSYVFICIHMYSFYIVLYFLNIKLY
jgi:hypothetical protein